MKAFPSTIRIPFAAGLVVATASLAFLPSARADVATYRQALQSTTWVLAKNSEGTSSGTGVLIDATKKLVVTNAHVVGDARSTVVFFPALEGDKPIVTRKHYLENVQKLGIRGQVIAVDRKRDLALVEIEKVPETARAIEMASGSCSPGEEVESIGNPGSTEALWVYTSGTVRAVYQKQFRTGAGEHDFTVVETQSPINTGDSGGPVVNRQGQLVAVSQAIAPNARLVSYFIDITEVKTFLASPWKPAPLGSAKVLESAELKYTTHPSGHFEVEIDALGGEKQKVFVAKDMEYFERADIRKVWSLASTLSQAPSVETMTSLLEQNARTKLGSWSVERTPSGEYLVIFSVKMDATATPDALKSTMDYVARLTAAMKKDLSKADQKKAQSATDTLSQWLAN